MITEDAIPYSIWSLKADYTESTLALHHILTESPISQQLPYVLPPFTEKQLKEGLRTPWTAEQIGRLAVKYESEWYADESLRKWNEIDDFYEQERQAKQAAIQKELEDKPAAVEYALEVLTEKFKSHINEWNIEKNQRIKPSLWWNEVVTAQQAQTESTTAPVLSKLPTDGKVWHLHPVGMSMFQTRKCFCHRDFTVDELINLGISANKSIEFIDDLNHTLNNYLINSCLKKLHFLAQISHESGGFIYTEEIASGSQYEGRKDLGNIEKGDGIKFKGRGLIQITGRKNYTKYGDYKQLNFIQGSNNLLLATLPYSIDSAGWYWKRYLNIDLSIAADENDLIYITYRINGGFNGFKDRKTKLINMLTQLECNNLDDMSTLFSIYDSRCFNLFDAVFKYAQLNNEESIGCYSQYLLLTQNYLNWNSIKGWKNDDNKKKYKEKIERNRQTARNKIR